MSNSDIQKSETENRLIELAESLFSPLGFQVVDADCRIGPRSLVRLFIDSEKGPNLDDCADASRLLGTKLETVEWLPGAFDLEVSSPGLDRRLRARSDFAAHVGEEVKLKLVAAVPGLGANVTGTLVAVGEGAPEITVSSQKKDWNIPLANVRQANLVWRFETPAKG